MPKSKDSKDKDNNVTIVISNCNCDTVSSTPASSQPSKPSVVDRAATFLFSNASSKSNVDENGTWDGSGTGPY